MRIRFTYAGGRSNNPGKMAADRPGKLRRIITKNGAKAPKRFFLQPDQRLEFFREFLRHPRQIGSVIPSSRFLETRLIKVAGVADARLVVELGPGTGGTTRAFLGVLGQASKLLAIDVDPLFVSMLEADPDPRLIAHSGGAEDIRDALSRHELSSPDVVISGIPFSTMPSSLGRRILAEVWASLSPGGCFVAYQFRGEVAELGREIMGEPEVEAELLNIPPMRVYRWVKPAETEQAKVSPSDREKVTTLG